MRYSDILRGPYISHGCMTGDSTRAIMDTPVRSERPYRSWAFYAPASDTGLVLGEVFAPTRSMERRENTPQCPEHPHREAPTNARAAGRSFAIFVVTSPVSLSPSEGAGKLRALLECGICHIISLMEPGRTGSEDGLCRMKKTGTGSVRKKIWMLPMSISRSRIWADSRGDRGHSMRSILA